MSNRVPARVVQAIGASFIGRIPIGTCLAFPDRSRHRAEASTVPGCV